MEVAGGSSCTSNLLIGAQHEFDVFLGFILELLEVVLNGSAYLSISVLVAAVSWSELGVYSLAGLQSLFLISHFINFENKKNIFMWLLYDCLKSRYTVVSIYAVLACEVLNTCSKKSLIFMAWEGDVLQVPASPSRTCLASQAASCSSKPV